MARPRAAIRRGIVSRWDTIRTHAGEQRTALMPQNAPLMPLTISGLLAHAATATGIAAVARPSGDSLLYGAHGIYDREMRMIWYDASLPHEMRHFVLAHEYAHHWLGHGTMMNTAAGLAPDMAEESEAMQQVEGYTPFDLAERSANVFARELLLPPDALVPWFQSRMWGDQAVPDVSALARHLGVPERLVYFQLTRALLLPPSSLSLSPLPHAPGDAIAGNAGTGVGAGVDTVRLDPGQREAAEWPRGPLLVEAGPGTGKTRTLVHRVHWLLQGGVSAESVLALTFSNRAAEELRSRVAAVRPTDAPRLWTGTMHAFALELLRKYAGEHITGLRPGFEVIDPVEARSRFTEIVVSLGLSHYDTLADPTAPFAAFARAFSRAKDELTDAAGYAALVHAMPSGDDRARAGEVARAFTAYQEMLARDNTCDYGDLLRHAVALLRDHADVRATVQAQYPHVLVDEYQDVNYACVELVRQLAGDGGGLWVVGDARQAIYGFRGAKAGILREFTAVFPGASVRALQTNYRSNPAIVAKINALAPHVGYGTGHTFTPWLAHRAEASGQQSEAFQYTVLPDKEAEANAIAAEMTRLHATGVLYREQAVLCRSHTVLRRIAAALDARGVPALFLGDLFERPEVRDLLSFVALAAGPDGRGLLRVARFPHYAVPDADVRVLLDAAQAREIAFPAALTLATAASLPGLSAAGREGLERIAADVAMAVRGGAGVHAVLVRYLFDRGEYLRAYVADDALAGQQRRLALFQLLDIAQAFGRREEGRGRDSLQTFGSYVCSTAITGEDRRFAQLPGWADALDAVRLLTVHAAKGLEFSAVFVPEMRDGHFPASGGGRDRFSCPPPPGLIPGKMPPGKANAEDGDDGDGDEGCIFFVALSRARDTLFLTRPARNGNGRTQRTPWLRFLGVGTDPDFPAAPPTPRTRHHGTGVLPAQIAAAVPPFDAHLLDRYRTCPRQYGYDYVWGFRERLAASAYMRFTRCTRIVLAEVAGARPGERLDEQAALTRLADLWATTGPPVDHPYARLYHRRAEKTVCAAVQAAPGVTHNSYLVDLPEGYRVRVTPDAVVTTDSTVTVTRWSMRTKDDRDDDFYGLYATVARTLAHESGKTWAVETRHLVGNTEPLPVRSAKNINGQERDRWVETRLGHYAEAIAGVIAGKYPAKPDDFGCPRCPYYFICPGAASST